MSHFPSLVPGRKFLLPALFTMAAVWTLPAQTVQEKPGLALVKPQAWSKKDEATVTEFLAYTDRTVQGTPGAGYYEFRTKTVDKRQIPAGKIAGLVIYPDTKNIVKMMDQSERDQVEKTVGELETAVTTFPATRTYLAPYIKELKGELAQFDSGKFKIDGVWQDKESYLAGQISSLGKQLKDDISKVKPTSSLDLQMDTRFTALNEMAKSSKAAETLVNEIKAQYDKLIRAETRQNLLTQLNDPKIAFTEAEGAFARLSGLKPEEDPQSESFVKKWNSALALVKPLKDASSPLAATMETEMTSVQDTSAPPVLSPELSGKVADVNSQVKILKAMAPPPVLLNEAGQAVALCNISDNLKKLSELYPEKGLLEAKDIVDSSIAQAIAIGPQTNRVFTELQANLGSRIEQFSKFREEAKLLLSANKPNESLAKFEAAASILNDQTVNEEIEKLKRFTAPQ